MKEITLLPADTYKVYNKSIISDYDKKVIINLYQPIIGPLSVSLYLTLLSDVDISDKDYTHHHLMVSLKNGLESIKEARESLESVGLIKTLVKVDTNLNNYIYEIYSPLTPNEFFNHPVLSVILHNNIGESEYKKLIEFYKKKNIDTKDYVNISKTIDKTFKSINSEMVDNLEGNETLGINIGNVIDFDMIISSIPSNIISDKAFNKKTRELINNLSFVYDIDTLRMIDLVRLSIDDNGLIDKDKIIKNVRHYYDFNNNGSLPTLIYRTQPEYLKEKSVDMSNRGKMLYLFENTTPYDFLLGKYKGIKPTSRDLKLLEYLAVELKMKPAVINVLIDYVLRINDNKLNRNYVEAIAGEWVRSRIETASDAMNRAEREHKKNKSRVFTNNKDNVPVWFDKNIEEVTSSDEDIKELEDLLKKYR